MSSKLSRIRRQSENAAAKQKYGFGGRERRRLLSGKRLPRTDAEVAFIASFKASA